MLKKSDTSSQNTSKTKYFMNYKSDISPFCFNHNMHSAAWSPQEFLTILNMKSFFNWCNKVFSFCLHQCIFVHVFFQHLKVFEAKTWLN